MVYEFLNTKYLYTFDFFKTHSLRDAALYLVLSIFLAIAQESPL